MHSVLRSSENQMGQVNQGSQAVCQAPPGPCSKLLRTLGTVQIFKGNPTIFNICQLLEELVAQSSSVSTLLDGATGQSCVFSGLLLLKARALQESAWNLKWGWQCPTQFRSLRSWAVPNWQTESISIWGYLSFRTSCMDPCVW